MINTIILQGAYSIYNTREVSYLLGFPHECIFFGKSFRVPKIVPKIGSKEYDCCLLKVILPFLTTH